jgi:hypothetical protein
LSHGGKVDYFVDTVFNYPNARPMLQRRGFLTDLIV